MSRKIRRHKPLRKPPMVLRLMRLAFRRLGRIFPDTMGAWAYRIWFRSHRYPTPKRELGWLAEAHRGDLQVRDMDVATWQWGQQGPLILLVHGWSGRGSQLGGFAAPLVEAGYRVLTFDAPGHGDSSGHHSTIFRYVETMEALQDEYTEIDAIIAHSFGVSCAAMAVAHGLPARRMVAISPPGSMHWLMNRFASTLHIPPATLQNLRSRLEQRFGARTIAGLDTVHNVRHLRIPGLVIHDEDDHDVPCSEGQAVARAWPGARLLLTRGLGHRRILRDHNTIQKALEFLSETGQVSRADNAA